MADSPLTDSSHHSSDSENYFVLPSSEITMAAEKMKVHAAEQPPEEEEEDLVDPMDEIREKCVEKHCSNFLEKLNECNDRKYLRLLSKNSSLKYS
ncbi:hypothetical protein TNIN_65121 [Trichonephila inaurata madagascariensis]|uniref:Uncharacterized protein n=1 Tax=Trichonephila inaurata madagascariensis TaxID=2747483 RepID=A0A8X6YJE1_9ARAC|nr:hypothetical protein TNIN_65121 [Trichonephila inaurata madagascariensis]